MKGTVMLVMPRVAKVSQVARSRGHPTRRIRTNAPAESIPNSTRKATSVNGPISCTAILIHKKEALQIAPRRMKMSQCLGLIISSLPYNVSQRVFYRSQFLIALFHKSPEQGTCQQRHPCPEEERGGRAEARPAESALPEQAGDQ